MEKQHFGNHKKKAPLIYYFSLLVLLVNFFIWMGKAIMENDSSQKVNAVLIATISFAGLILGYFARSLALKAQDRAILAEENLRHFVMTGKLHDSRLSRAQIIALRFASDEEFVDLSKLAATENLSANEIKQRIKNWKADHHRV